MRNGLAESGSHMPAESEPHEGAWLQWPHNNVEPGYQLRQEHTGPTIVSALYQYEAVHIFTRDEWHRDHVAYRLDHFGLGQDGIDLHSIPTVHVWARANSPILVVNDQNDLIITNWAFDGWGNRFETELDKQVPAIIGVRPSIPALNHRWYWRILAHHCPSPPAGDRQMEFRQIPQAAERWKTMASG